MKTIVWFGFVLGAVSAAGTVIYTTPHSKATLDCGVRTFRGNLVWYHGGEMVLSIDGRSGYQHRGNADLTSRVRVKGDTKLEIPHVKQEDAGTFTCEADGTKHEHTLAVVSVSASPTHEPELGTSVTLQCRVNGQTPGSTVQWTRPDGTTVAGTESGTVELRSVASSDAGTWKCIINPGGTPVDLDLKVKGPSSGMFTTKVSAAGTVIYTTPHSKATLDCGVRTFRGNLVWYHGGEMVLSIDGRSGLQRRGNADLTSRVRVKGDTKLEIYNVKQEDAGTFTCEADGTKHEHTLAVVSVSTNPPDEREPGTTTVAGPESGTVKLQSVASSDAGTWKFMINPGVINVNLKLTVKVLGAVPTAGTVIYTTPHSKATLDCGVRTFRGNLVWYHGGEMVLSIDGRSGYQHRGRSDIASRARATQDAKLEIYDVRQEDAGTFTCEADGIKHEYTLAVVSGQQQI